MCIYVQFAILCCDRARGLVKFWHKNHLEIDPTSHWKYPVAPRFYKLQNAVLNSGLQLGATLPSCHTTANPIVLLTWYTAHVSKRDMTCTVKMLIWSDEIHKSNVSLVCRNTLWWDRDVIRPITRDCTVCTVCTGCTLIMILKLLT